MTAWVDTHCHLDAPEFRSDTPAVRARAATNNVALCVIPAVGAFNFDAARELAHQTGDAYALGTHPLYTPQAADADVALLDAALTAHRDDPRLVAVGEIGLDYFAAGPPQGKKRPPRGAATTRSEGAWGQVSVPGLDGPRQEFFYREQLRLARRHGLPVILHVRRSADQLLKHLRQIGPDGWQGIAHAFNGSTQQAQAFIDLGFKLGFGGAVTFDRALQLRRLASTLPLSAIVLETDAPDIPPHWLYRTAEQRASGLPQGRNEPGELPRIGAVVAGLRGMAVDELRDATTRNAVAALPKLAALLPAPGWC
ncbi:MAG: TatD family hydrolase [Xylophilus sp.]|nr:TatD family hydrolase [Burkholderiaceae bacterium]MBP6652994.1 TatD family hydrolase [Xylophilus sp.]MBP8229972.1 TatD family hydrolase [Xylophilus sp.]